MANDKIAHLLEGKSRKERHLMKAQALQKVTTKSFSIDNITVNIVKGPSLIGDILRLEVDVFVNGVLFESGKLLDYLNPPVKAETSPGVFEENHELALKSIVLQTIKTYVRSKNV